MSGMTREALAQETTRILTKKARQEALSRREERILAYGHYAATCSSCWNGNTNIRVVVDDG